MKSEATSAKRSAPPPPCPLYPVATPREAVLGRRQDGDPGCPSARRRPPNRISSQPSSRSVHGPARGGRRGHRHGPIATSSWPRVRGGARQEVHQEAVKLETCKRTPSASPVTRGQSWPSSAGTTGFVRAPPESSRVQRGRAPRERPDHPYPESSPALH